MYRKRMVSIMVRDCGIGELGYRSSNVDQCGGRHSERLLNMSKKGDVSAMILVCSKISSLTLATVKSPRDRVVKRAAADVSRID